jgi:hypothetical protein
MQAALPFHPHTESHAMTALYTTKATSPELKCQTNVLRHAVADGDFSVGSIDSSTLPLDASCKPVYPHQYMEVNNVFQVSLTFESAARCTAYMWAAPAHTVVTCGTGQ